MYFGYSPNLGIFLINHPKGNFGDCFINGETKSLWIWDDIAGMWIDSNRVENYLQGVVSDVDNFTPIVNPGVRTTYLYVAPKAGVYTFANFKNGGTAISVTVGCTSVVMLYWNGDYWETAITPVDIDMSAYLESAVFEAYKSETGDTLSDHSNAISTLQQSVDDIVGDAADTSSSATLNGALNGVRANEAAIKSLNDEIGTPDDLPTGDTDATIWGALNTLVNQTGDDRTAMQKLEAKVDSNQEEVKSNYALKSNVISSRGAHFIYDETANDGAQVLFDQGFLKMRTIDGDMSLGAEGGTLQFVNNGDTIDLPKKAGTIAFADDIPDTSIFATKAEVDELSSEVGDMKPSIQDNATDITEIKGKAITSFDIDEAEDMVTLQPVNIDGSEGKYVSLRAATDEQAGLMTAQMYQDFKKVVVKTIPCVIMDGSASVQINALTEEDYANGVQVVLKDTYSQTSIPLQYMYKSGTLHFWFVAYEPSYEDMAVWRGETDDILGASNIICRAYLLS